MLWSLYSTRIMLVNTTLRLNTSIFKTLRVHLREESLNEFNVIVDGNQFTERSIRDTITGLHLQAYLSLHFVVSIIYFIFLFTFCERAD